MAAPNSNFIPFFNPNPNPKESVVEAVVLDSDNGGIISNGVLTSYSIDVPTFFNPNSSYVELSVHDVITQELLQYGDYNIRFYSLETTPSSSQAVIDPALDINFILPASYFTGEYGLESDVDFLLRYYFLDLEIGNWNSKLYISEISSDRQELRLDSLDINDFTLANQTNSFIQKRIESPYFLSFYLNFGLGNLVECINIKLDNIPGNSTVLVKLKEPLPDDFELNDTLWVVSRFSEPQYYKVTLPDNPPILQDTENIKAPNFNLSVKDQVNNSTLELSYLDLIASPLTSSQHQLNSILEETQLDINIDYTDFSNFVHFSSAQTRLENFYYKVSLIEQYSSSISILNNSPSSPGVSSSIALYESKINNLITNFDGYEYYLYYESGSWTWPKLNTEPPYQLAPLNSSQVISWLGNGNEDSPLYSGILASASIYDRDNRDELKKSIPEYLRDDSENEPYELFIDMVAQHYDSVWVYIKDVINKYDSDNRLNFGISRDLVADAIRDFGVKLYQNNFSNEDLFTAFLGLTPEGGLFPFPNITGSLPTPSGFEYIDQFISASNDYMPLDDVNKSLYKRIYHNLPYLLKSKGTLPGLRALITSYGIPDTILRINEYGGKDKINSNDWDYWQNEFNYAFYTSGDNFISSSFSPINSDWNSSNGVPESLMFRFKSTLFPEIDPSSSLLIWNNVATNWEDTPYIWDYNASPAYSQSLWSKQFDTVYLTLTYTGSGYLSGSYSGSIINPDYQYANLTLYPSYASDPTISASLYLPFFDGGWWSIMINSIPSGSGYNTFELYAANKIYEGGDNNTRIGFIASASVVASDGEWVSNGDSYFASSSIINGSTYNSFSGSLQEIRYYVNPISESVFRDYTMNPYSFEGNSTNSAPNELLFRAPLGGELYTGSISIHPKITGSWIATHSFVSNSDFYFNQIPTFIPNKEYFFYDQPIAGIKNTISDKIRIEDNVMPEGDTLSPFMSLSQMANVSQSYTQNINYLEVAFSPTNEINEDIMDQIGSFNIGEYIGDPRLRSSSAVTYPDLDKLRNEYFQKYISNYNLTDFIRLIKFFDNSLFKMIRDFVPARTSLASGIVIKQHLLERNKYPQPQADTYSTIAYQASGSSPNISNNVPFTFQNIIVSGTLKPTWNGYNEGTVENLEGGTGGVFEPFNSVLNTSQSWLENYQTISGSVVILHNFQDEFYNGEFSGSTILISDGILNEAYPPTVQAFEYKQVHYYGTSFIEDGIFENNYLNNNTLPENGEILFFNKAMVPSTDPFPLILVTKYLKISKFDCNGNDLSIPLSTVTKLTIYNPIIGQNIIYDVININEQSTFYLYETSEPYVSSFWPNQVLDYTISASRITPSFVINPGDNKPIQSLTESIDTLGYFDPLSGLLTFQNTPNTPIIISASFNLNSPVNGNSGSFQLIKNGDTTDEFVGTQILSQTFNLNSGANIVLFTGSFYPLNGDNYYIRIFNEASPFDPSTITFNSIQYLITQSRAVSSSLCDLIIFEPYITTPNFYNSDENALLNNAFDLRDSKNYLDVDYSRGIMTPVNFQQLIDKTATKAKVQDSNYTTLRHIIPRYLGSKSTSLYLNKWTTLDNGTFGKLPTIENLKSYVAYGFMDGSWIPERMNASAFTIKYLIDQDGNVLTPNLSQISLPTVQQNFPTGDRFRYSSILPQNNPGGVENQFRNIIKGGYRIEPILYTQVGAQPGASWVTGSDVISFTNIIPADQGTVTDVSGKYGLSTTLNYTGDSIVTFPSLVTGTGLTDSPPSLGPIVASSSYEVPLEVIDEGINLSIGVKLLVNYNDPSPSTYNFDSLAVVIKRTTPLGNSSILFQKWINSDYSQFNGIAYPNALYTNTNYTIYVPALGEENLNPNEPVSPLILPGQQQGFFTIPSSVLGVGDKITVEVFYPYSGPETLQIFSNSSLIINQYPIALPSIDIPAPYTPNTLWGYPDPLNYPYIITSSNAGLCQAYGNPKIKQVNISGSGFNPTQLPFLLDVGDEFRFEGREDYTFEIKKIYAPQDEEDDYQIPRIFPTGSIEVHFSKDLPVSASVNSFNLDHFLIRKYITDPTQIIFEGFRPQNGAFPNSFVITPEYVIPQLDKNADEYVKILTEKGLIN